MNKKIRNQSGVIPIYYDKTEPKVVLITPRCCTGVWIFPKGNIKNGLTPPVSAAEEAYEEAGLKGIINPEIIGQYHYVKYNRVYRVSMYLLEVKTILDDFPEIDDRNRIAVSIKKAMDLLHNGALKKLLGTAQNNLNIKGE